jgi:hypothetical protein
MTPLRIQRRRTRGWRMPETAVYVGRPTSFGNPFALADVLAAGEAASVAEARRLVVDAFRRWIDGGERWSGPDSDRARARILARLPELAGKDLACWCPLDGPCHADVLLELANR